MCAECAKHNSEGVQCAYESNGFRYIIEQSRTEHRDGAITGTIWRSCIHENAYRRGGSFRVEGDGSITRAPAGEGLLFVINEGSNTVRSFTYDSTGALTVAAHPSISSGGTDPRAIAIDIAKKMLFVANQTTNDIKVLTYDSNAQMTAKGSIVDCGGQAPSGLLFIP